MFDHDNHSFPCLSPFLLSFSPLLFLLLLSSLLFLFPLLFPFTLLFPPSPPSLLPLLFPLLPLSSSSPSSSLSFSPLSPPQAIPHCTRPSSLSYTTSSSCVTDSRKMRKMGMRELLVIGQLYRSPPTQPHAPHPPPSPLGNSLSLPSPSPSPRVVIQFSSGLTWCLLRDTSLFQCSSQLPLIQLVVGSVSSDLLFYTG